jgi:hypothetical protein
MESKPKLLLTVKEFAQDAKDEEVKKAPYKNAEAAKDVVWSLKCKCLDLVCTLNPKDLATTAEAKVKSLTKKTNARLAMERKSRKKRNCLKLKSIRDLQMAITTLSMVKLMNTQE